MDNVLLFPNSNNVARPQGAFVLIDPAISRKCAALIDANFGDTNSGIEFILESFYHLYMAGLKGLKRKFSDTELRAFISVMRDVTLQPHSAGTILLSELVDKVRTSSIDKEMRFNWYNLKARLLKRSRTDMTILEIWAHGFWDGSRRGHRNEEALKRHVSILA